MQIHNLPEQATSSDTDQYALDTGSTTRKISFANLKNQILQKANPEFTSGDSSTANSWTDVAALVAGEVMTSILNKVSVMFKNIRYLYKMLGTTNISGVGDGTVTGGINALANRRTFSDGLGVNKTAGQDGNPGVWANSAGNLFMTGAANVGSYIFFYFNRGTTATSNLRESAAGRLTASGVFNASAVGSGHKTAYNDGNTGVWLQSSGNVDISNAAGGSIQFHYANSANPTSRIYESETGVISSSARFTALDYAGNSRQMVGTATTDGNRIAYLSSNENILNINGQHGTTGDTYTNKSISFSTSDIRLKENIKDSEVDALSAILAMKPREFDWTDDRDEKHQKIGLVADELEEIDTRLAVGGGYDEDGHMNIKSVDTFYLVGYLVKAVQELTEEVETLKRELRRERT